MTSGTVDNQKEIKGSVNEMLTMPQTLGSGINFAHRL